MGDAQLLIVRLSNKATFRLPILEILRSNSALLTDTYTSPLRAQYGAAKRERWASQEHGAQMGYGVTQSVPGAELVPVLHVRSQFEACQLRRSATTK